MSEQMRDTGGVPGSAEPGPPGVAEPGTPRAGIRRIHTGAEKLAILNELNEAGATVHAVAARHGIERSTIWAWKRRLAERGPAGLEPGRGTRTGLSRKHGPYTPEERRAAVESCQKSGILIGDFARTWGVSAGTLHTWLRSYREAGPQGLERIKVGRPRGKGRSQLPAGVQSEIVIVRRRFPDFGLKKVRDTSRPDGTFLPHPNPSQKRRLDRWTNRSLLRPSRGPPAQGPSAPALHPGYPQPHSCDPPATPQ